MDMTETRVALSECGRVQGSDLMPIDWRGPSRASGQSPWPPCVACLPPGTGQAPFQNRALITTVKVGDRVLGQ